MQNADESNSCYTEKTLKYFIFTLDGIHSRLSIDNWVPRSRMLLYLHHRDSEMFFHTAKFDNSKDEKISDFKIVSVSHGENFLD